MEEIAATDAAGQQEACEESALDIELRARFERYLARAAEIPAREVKDCHANVQEVLKNVRKGVAAVSSPEIAEQIARELPTVDLGALLEELSQMAETLVYASRLLAERPTSEPRFEKKRARARSIRRRLLTQMEVLADDGVVASEELEPLYRDHRGNLALANDLIDAAAFFAHLEPESADEVTIEPGLIAEALELGLFLRARLKPVGPFRRRCAQKSSAARKRDRLWALLNRRHRELRRAAAWLWLKEADEHVPPLAGRLRTRSKVEPSREDEETLAVA